MLSIWSAKMALLGEVAIKVIRVILLTKEFTVSQIADIIAIKHDSVETVIQRLLKDGLLVKVSKADLDLKSKSIAKKGRPKQFYTIAENNKLKILRDRVNAFSLERSIAEPYKNKPSNPHYLRALSIIESVELEKLEFTDQLRNEASNNLALARDYEEMVDENNDVSVACIDFAQAKLEYLKGEKEDAEDLLKNAKNIFRKYELPEEHAVDEYLISSKLKHAIREANKSIKNNAYKTLGEQLLRLADDFSAFPNLPSVTKSIKEFIGISSHISSLTAEYMEKKIVLEKQLHSLTSENQVLRLQQTIALEISADLTGVLKEITATTAKQYIHPALQPMPEPSFVQLEDSLQLPKNVIRNTGKMSSERKVH
jgi:predicted transcriptional regulator